MHGLEINGTGELKQQLANPSSPGKWMLKWSIYVCVYCLSDWYYSLQHLYLIISKQHWSNV